jgi:subtilase family serine protease
MHLRTRTPLAAALGLAMLAGCAGASRALLPTSLNAASDGAATAANALGRDVVADVPMPDGNPPHDLGRAPSNLRLLIAVTLRYRQEPQLQRFIARQEMLPSGSRPHWLTNEQFDARFAPSPSDYARVVASLQRAGIRVTRQFDNRTVIDAEGSVGALEEYFGTEVHRVEQPGYGIRYANVRPGYAPANLGGMLVSVDGLSTLSMVHPFTAPSPSGGSGPDAKGAGATKLFGPPDPTRMDSTGYAAAAFENAYDFPATHHNGNVVYDGSGHGTAFVMDADFVDSDLATFLNYFSITRRASKTIRVPVDGGTAPGNEASDTIYTTFIVENMAALAPGADLYVYEVHPGLALSTITDAYNRIVSENRVDSVATSFGNCEVAIATTEKAWNAIAEQGLAKGIVFAAGSGDSGGVLCANAPASAPNFTAVGGTSLEIGPRGVWFAEPADFASSGGVSRVFPLPSWQNAVPGTLPSGRNLPDVAFDANTTEGAAGYLKTNGGWSAGINPYYGTGLLATSIYAAALTELDQLKGERTGLASEKLFQLWKATGYGTPQHPYFHDAVEGGSGLHFAVPGYDFVTGIGSIDFFNLAQKL